MGNKFLTPDNPEYSALTTLITRSSKIHILPSELEWVLWEAKCRHDTEKSGVGIQTAQYDAARIFKRQALGLLGEYAFYKFALAAGVAIDADFTRNTKKQDMTINDKPIGVKLCVWQDNEPMTPQIDTGEYRMHPVPQAIIYAKFNNPRLLDSGWEVSKNALQLNWICCIGIIEPAVLLGGLDADYGVGSNPRKAGFTQFSKIETPVSNSKTV